MFVASLHVSTALIYYMSCVTNLLVIKFLLCFPQVHNHDNLE